MTTPMETLDALLKAGKRSEALALLKAEKIKARFYPTEIIQVEGKPLVFKNNGKKVEMDDQGNWHLKK